MIFILLIHEKHTYRWFKLNLLKRGGGGALGLPNIAIPQEKLANTVWKIDEIPLPRLPLLRLLKGLSWLIISSVYAPYEVEVICPCILVILIVRRWNYSQLFFAFFHERKTVFIGTMTDHSNYNNTPDILSSLHGVLGEWLPRNYENLLIISRLNSYIINFRIFYSARA